MGKWKFSGDKWLSQYHRASEWHPRTSSRPAAWSYFCYVPLLHFSDSEQKGREDLLNFLCKSSTGSFSLWELMSLWQLMNFMRKQEAFLWNARNYLLSPPPSPHSKNSTGSLRTWDLNPFTAAHLQSAGASELMAGAGSRTQGSWDTWLAVSQEEVARRKSKVNWQL